MNGRGRKSSAALAVVVESGVLSSLRPPPGLTEGERQVWKATVESKPTEWFGPEHIPVMVEYVRHVCHAAVIDAEIKAVEPDSLKTSEGLARFDRLTAMRTRNAGMIARLATNMRITHQSVWRPSKAALTTKATKALWQDEARSEH
jgi:hypothetical protein